MRIGIIGCRARDSFKDYMLVCETVLKLQERIEITDIVSGGCKKGGDRFAEIIAHELKIIPTIFYPQCSKNSPKYIYREEAFKRNWKIAQNSDILIALVSKERTGGTEDTIRKFLLHHAEKDLILI